MSPEKYSASMGVGFLGASVACSCQRMMAKRERGKLVKILQTYVRIYVTELDPAIAFYESLTGQQTDLRFPYPEMGLELASVGPFLILAGFGEALAPFRETLATFQVDSVEDFRGYLTKNGARIIRDIKRVPTGSNMTVQHPDGTRFEYVQHHI